MLRVIGIGWVQLHVTVEEGDNRPAVLLRPGVLLDDLVSKK